MTLRFISSFDTARGRPEIQKQIRETERWNNDHLTWDDDFGEWSLQMEGYLGGWALVGAGSIAEGVNIRSANDWISDEQNSMSFWVKLNFEPPIEDYNVGADCVMGFGRGDIFSAGVAFFSRTNQGGSAMIWTYSSDAAGNMTYEAFDQQTILEDDTWYHIEILTRTTQTYRVEVRVNGLPVMVRTGSDASSILGAQTWPHTRFGGWFAIPGSTFLNGNYFAIDHLIVYDDDGDSSHYPKSWIGPRIVEEMIPISDRQSDYTGAPDPEEPNYENVDDGETRIYDDSNYNETLIDAALDLYSFNKPARIMGQIDSMMIDLRWQSEDLNLKVTAADGDVAATFAELLPNPSGFRNDQVRVLVDPIYEAYAGVERTRKIDVDKIRELYWGVGDFNVFVPDSEILEDGEPPGGDELELDYGTLTSPSGTPLDKGSFSSPSGEGVDLGGF